MSDETTPQHLMRENEEEGGELSSPPVSLAVDPQPDDLISFLCEPDLVDLLPKPEPAARFIPEWFRNLDRNMGVPDAHGLASLTVKACLPVTDAFTLGWIIPLAFEVRVIIPEDGVNIQIGWAPEAPFKLVEQHHPGQIGAPSPPFERTMPLKFINPWRIRVPEGYSVLFTPPFNHFELPFTCFTGLVDCDRFAAKVNLPFALTGPPGQYSLPAGTPLAQVIPIAREAMLPRHEVRASSSSELHEQGEATYRKHHEPSLYRREWRQRK
ncbi:MAG: hypothetical protein GYB36_06645 [Alphaproteobacteria bacterium]|nr:hypothetical protein [Alphaproteobacteria bacterium]